MLVRFWTDKAGTIPDDTASSSTFKLTIRRNSRDSGDPLVYVESGDGIEVDSANSVLVSLSEAQTEALIGCKSPQYALQRDGQTIYDGSVVLEYTVIQAGP